MLPIMLQVQNGMQPERNGEVTQREIPGREVKEKDVL